ncbi:MAG TPA: hypothetical protein VMM38_12210 [Aridibacter sp.]|nr:hypothetical protein [Aridibacter sp.]
MNKRIFACAALAVLAAVSFAAAQNKTPDYSGKWKLDMSKSELGERSMLESMDMTVEQTADTLSVERTPKFARGGEGVGGLAGGNLGGGKMTYDLSGKETKSEGAMGGEVALTAEVGKEGGLILLQKRNLDTQMGSFSIKTLELWKLSADGKTLTVLSSTETPRGNRSQKMVFSRQ